MNCMYKIGVIGDYDSICGFSALGLDIFPVTDSEEGSKTLKNLVTGGEYGIIYITEVLGDSLKNEIAVYNEKITPAIILIPSNNGSLGIGIANVKHLVEQAVGSDILFADE